MKNINNVLILSKNLAGGVKYFSEIIKKDGNKPLLVSDQKGDLNAKFCDEHIYIDWGNYDKSEIKHTLEKYGKVEFIINAVEELIPHYISFCKELKIDNGSLNALEHLTSKSELRRQLKRIAIFDCKFLSDSLKNFPSNKVDFFPLILKPSKQSGASKFVFKILSQEELNEKTVYISNFLDPKSEFIAEEYFDGIEFSMDGIVTENKFEELYSAEKIDFNYEENKDGDYIISPPVNIPPEHLNYFREEIQKIVEKLTWNNIWLHIEARYNRKSFNIIEINPRIGGGEYFNAVRKKTAINPIDAIYQLACNNPQQIRNTLNRNDQKYLQATFHAPHLGVLSSHTPLKNLLALDNVLTGHIIKNFHSQCVNQENIFAGFLLESSDEEGLLESYSILKKVFSYNFSFFHPRHLPQKFKDDEIQLIKLPDESFLDDVYLNARDQDISLNMEWPQHKTINDTKEFFKFCENDYKEEKGIHYAIVNKNKCFIGVTSLINVDPIKKIAEVTTWLGKKYWGQGYNFRIRRTIFKLAFVHLALDKIYFRVAENNTNNIKSLSKMKLEQMGFHDQKLLIKDKEVKALLFELRASTYFQSEIWK